MHRSGTSLVANLLRLCGLHLGEEQDILPASVDNTEGYWENRKFVLLHNEVLLGLGGSWDLPPVLPDDWPYQERLHQLRVKAELLIEEFTDREPWGWKDPRTSLILPFWQSLDGITMPFWLGRGEKLRVVLCLRDPLEVFQSLRDRNFTPNASGLELWLTYNQKILQSTLPEDRIVTHYEAYFQDTNAELTRVLNFLNMKVSPEVISQSAGIVSSAMRHKRSDISALRDAKVSPEIIELYVALCEEANHLQPLESYSLAS
jgi:hypothetical protein